MDSQEHGFPEVKSGTSNPKRFSFPQTMQQLDNTHPRGMVAHPESYKAFHRAQGEPQKRQPIFPALQRFQKNPIQPHSQNQSHHQQQPQRPFFSLLQAKPFTPAPKDRYFMQEQLNGRNMKIEELSDKTPSSPPSATPPKLLPAPQHQIISPFSPGPHISTLRGQHHPQPYQILPPPPPPLGPTSHPTSHEKFREASTREEISIGVEDSKFHGNADPADLPDIAIKALRQVQVANAELAEERHRSKTLTAELAALRISHEALTDQHATVQQDLQATREQVETSQRQLEAAVKERDLSQVRLAEIKENAGKMKKDFAELGESYTGLRTGFEQLKVLYEKAEVKSRELAEAKKYATDGLQALEPLLDLDGNYARGKQVKLVLAELQDENADSRRVIDLLRDKLYHLPAQLAEAKARIKELEAEERRLIFQRIHTDGDVKPDVREVDLVEKMDALIERLIIREQETIGALAEAEGCRERLSLAQAEITNKDAKIEELRVFKDTKVILELRIRDFVDKVGVLEDALATSNAEVSRTREEVAGLQVRLAEMEASSDTMRRELEGAKQEAENAKVLQDALKTSNTELAHAQKGLRVQLAEKQKSLEGLEHALETMKQESTKAYQAAELQRALLQQNVDAQSRELKMAKEAYGDMQKESKEQTKLLQAADLRAAALQERFDARGVLLERAQRQCMELKEANQLFEAELESTKCALDATRKELMSEKTASIASALDFASKLAANEEHVRERVDAVGQEAQTAHRMSRLLEVLEQRLARLETGHAEEQGEKAALVERVKELSGELDRLERLNQDILKRTSGLKKRYEANELNDEEKLFVEWLMQLSTSLHEQDAVAKDNELRRRETMNLKLQGKVRELESTLARMLKEKEKDAGVASKSIIDLNAWMSSSPDPQNASINPVDVVMEPPPDNLTSLAPAPAPIDSKKPLSTNALATPKSLPTSGAVPVAMVSIPNVQPTILRPVGIPTVNNLQSFRELDGLSSIEDSGSEEEIPLSEMSASATVLGKREREPSPAKPRTAGTSSKIQNTGAPSARRLKAPIAIVAAPPKAPAVAIQKKGTDSNAAKPKRKKK